ncbi:hypothetical protein [Nitriliruptor alkaliphilus]|uniref:hypothetical protein n=1 Tax=Nitriliruptor alkaliphilus TaxID=427918 RepID=UPI000698FD93|nr:hypothetical protein [Nitriliruptor alkaliphilus]
MTSFRTLRRSSTALLFAGALALGAAACEEDNGAMTDDTTVDGGVDDGGLDDGGLDDDGLDDGGLDDDGLDDDA